ncbi:unnamed protein product [Darwinula stevensoni]|uniref:Peptidase S1 domain-containing protein n=1 Tax=Darwinula stevensoni TaxID=69355 RepID=A0A7R8XJY9_9CRUS|nr:unnamed protein product [Darwinula stevensoni]CAG0895801.1 unnamed protein product [Darwinula stevensoni]
MNGYLAFVALLALPRESLQGWITNTPTTGRTPTGTTSRTTTTSTTTTALPSPCSRYTSTPPLFLPTQCGRWNLPPASTSSSWFTRFLEIFLLPLVGSELENREEDPLIIGGAPATIAEAPWMAYVSITKPSGSFYCTGSIIDQLHVLTAAHCIMDGTNLATAVSVRVGSENYQLGTTYTAATWRPHTSYDNANFVNGHDIAVIKLNQALTFSPSVQPICVPRSDSLSDAGACPAKIFGWGRTTETPAVRPLVVQKLDVTVLPKESCLSEFNKGVICVQGIPSGSGTCSGDSGGPLVVYVGSVAYVMGVDSYHQGSCAQYPSRYTWVTANVDFISTEVMNGSKVAVAVVVVAVTPNTQAYDAIPFWIIGQATQDLKRQAYKAMPLQAKV